MFRDYHRAVQGLNKMHITKVDDFIKKREHFAAAVDAKIKVAEAEIMRKFHYPDVDTARRYSRNYASGKARLTLRNVRDNMVQMLRQFPELITPAMSATAPAMLQGLNDDAFMRRCEQEAKMYVGLLDQQQWNDKCLKIARAVKANKEVKTSENLQKCRLG